MRFSRFSKIQFFVWISVLISFALSPAISEARRYQGPEKRAELVIDAQTGRILHSYAADQKRYPASTTKMLTLYMIFDALEKGKIKPSTPMRMTREIRTLGGRNGGVLFTGVPVGGTITVKEGIYALITKSANDIAILFGRTLAGSEQNFARQMTQTAYQLGMRNSNFTNPSGLPDRNQYTTVRDMALLGVRLMQRFPAYYKYFGTKNIRIKGQNLHNHNGMLITYKGMDGFKTGYINMSGFNLVASAKRGNKRLIGVMFGGSSVAARNYRMKQIMDKGWVEINHPERHTAFLGSKVQNIAALETRYSPLDAAGNVPVMVASAPKNEVKKVEPKVVRKTNDIEAVKNAAMIANQNARATLQDTRPNAAVVEVASNEATNSIKQPMMAPVADEPAIVNVPAPPKNELFAKIDQAAGINIEKILDSNIPSTNIVTENKTPIIKSLDMRLPSENLYEKKPHVLPIKDGNSSSNPVRNPFQNATKGEGWQIQFHDAQKDKSILTLQNSHTSNMMVVGKNNAVKGDYVADIINNYDDGKPHASLAAYILQVGAFSQKDTADSYMGSLKNNVSLLSKAETMLKTEKKGEGVIYRAMFSGLSANSAKTACKEIKKQGKQCVVVAQAS